MAANLQDLLALIPEGAQYDSVRFSIQRISESFPERLGEITPERLSGWVTEIDSGDGRDGLAIRNDIFTHIITPEYIQDTLGVDLNVATQLAQGGLTFSDFFAGDDGAAGVATEEGDFSEEEQEDAGVGGGGEDPETQLTILTGKEMEWFFDKSSGKWYVQYGLPNSDQAIVFEADPAQMDALFGDGQRPVQFNDQLNIEAILAPSNVMFGQGIDQMAGTGEFEDLVERGIALALDDGVLPAWATDTGEILDIIYLSEAQGKSIEWLVEKISQTESFKTRFPGFEAIRKAGNMDVFDGITAFLEFEAGVKASVNQVGGNMEAVTPEVIGGLLQKGFTLATVTDAVSRFDRMTKFKPALDAFNKILVEKELDPIESLQDQFDFLSGVAPSEVYDIWEASSLSEAAEAAGLGDLFTAEDAMAFAVASEGAVSLEGAESMFSQAATLLLRLRHEVDTEKFGITQEDLLNLSLSQPLDSGISSSELTENINRAIASAQGSLQKRVKPFAGFQPGSTKKVQTFTGLRES
jgi:hypothetical protein